MHKLLPILLLLSTVAADTCVAQTVSMNILCADCRDPHQYPNDYVNFAFNQLYGPDAWLSYDQADDFFVTNLNQQTVYVDVDFVFLGFGFEGLRLPVWPTNLLQFTLALPDGTLYTALRSIFQIRLPVPSSDDTEPSDTNSGTSSDTGGDGDGDGDEEDDDYAEFYDWEEPEYDDYQGFTGIEDPDEYGFFDDVDWCQEC